MRKTISQKILLVSVLSLLVCQIACGQNCRYEQKLTQIERIDKDIQNIEKVGFMNGNIFAFGGVLMDKRQEEVFEHVKLKKFTAIKIDVSDELNQQKKRTIKNDSNHKQTLSSSIHYQQQILSNLSTIATFSIPSKRSQGMNFYNHILLKLNSQFYSLQGDKLYFLPDSHSQSNQNQNLPSPLISHLRNQNFFTAQYFLKDTYREDKKWLSLKINQVQMKSRELKQTTEIEFNNLVVENVLCAHNGTYDASKLHRHFFTFSSYQNKRVYYILVNHNEMNFYLYSEKAQQLVLDQNKTLYLNELISQQHEDIRITKIIRMNTHLIVVTNRNHLFSINLLAYLNGKKREYLNLYEMTASENQPIVDVKFNDQDFRYFFVVTQRNVYQYHISQHKILRKFGLEQQMCAKSQVNIANQDKRQNIKKCTEDVHVLEKYLMVQYRSTIFDKQSAISRVYFQFNLIDKQSGSIHEYNIPFSHQKKCQQTLKKLLFTKNKNSHYIITLACFIKQNPTSEFPTHNHLILQHLNLQTSDQLLPQSQLGGIDFSKFRLPMIVFSIGLICYITIKRNSRKSPEKEIEEQKMNQKFQQEIMETIKREKDRQESLKSVRAAKGNNKLE